MNQRLKMVEESMLSTSERLLVNWQEWKLQFYVVLAATVIRVLMKMTMNNHNPVICHLIRLTLVYVCEGIQELIKASHFNFFEIIAHLQHNYDESRISSMKVCEELTELLELDEIKLDK